MHNAKERIVASTYNLATWVLFATHHLIMIICANLFFKIPLHLTKLLAGHKQVSLKPMHKVYERTVTSTFNLAIWFMIATYCLVMMIMCAKLCSKLITHNKVMGRTQTGTTEVYAQSLSVDCDRDL